MTTNVAFKILCNTEIKATFYVITLSRSRNMVTWGYRAVLAVCARSADAEAALESLLITPHNKTMHTNKPAPATLPTTRLFY